MQHQCGSVRRGEKPILAEASPYNVSSHAANRLCVQSPRVCRGGCACDLQRLSLNQSAGCRRSVVRTRQSAARDHECGHRRRRLRWIGSGLQDVDYPHSRGVWRGDLARGRSGERVVGPRTRHAVMARLRVGRRRRRRRNNYRVADRPRTSSRAVRPSTRRWGSRKCGRTSYCAGREPGLPLSLSMNTRILAGCVWLAFFDVACTSAGFS